MVKKISKAEMTKRLKEATHKGRWKTVRKLIRYPDSRFTEAGKKTARVLRGSL